MSSGRVADWGADDLSVVGKNKYSYLYLKVGYKDMIGTIGPVLIVGERRTVFLLV